MTDNGNNGPEGPQTGADGGAGGTPAPEDETANNDVSLSGEESATREASSGGAPEEKGERSPEAEFEALLAQLADAEDRYLRSHAEMENLRKRTDRQLAERSKYAVQKFAESVLTVGDNIQRALQAVPEDEIEGSNTLKSLVEGIRLTERELNNVLERHGVTAFDAEGAQLDPNIHSAMFEIENAQVPPGTILQVLQQGYMIGDRLLRPAQVGVAKGGPKAGDAPETVGEGSEPPVTQAANDDHAGEPVETSAQPEQGTANAPAPEGTGAGAGTAAANPAGEKPADVAGNNTEDVAPAVPDPDGNRGENI